jgi:hypothetical protein
MRTSHVWARKRKVATTARAARGAAFHAIATNRANRHQGIDGCDEHGPSASDDGQLGCIGARLVAGTGGLAKDHGIIEQASRDTTFSACRFSSRRSAEGPSAVAWLEPSGRARMGIMCCLIAVSKLALTELCRR